MKWTAFKLRKKYLLVKEKNSLHMLKKFENYVNKPNTFFPTFCQKVSQTHQSLSLAQK